MWCPLLGTIYSSHWQNKISRQTNITNEWNFEIGKLFSFLFVFFPQAVFKESRFCAAKTFWYIQRKGPCTKVKCSIAEVRILWESSWSFCLQMCWSKFCFKQVKTRKQYEDLRIFLLLLGKIFVVQNLIGNERWNVSDSPQQSQREIISSTGHQANAPSWIGSPMDDKISESTSAYLPVSLPRGKKNRN